MIIRVHPNRTLADLDICGSIIKRRTKRDVVWQAIEIDQVYSGWICDKRGIRRPISTMQAMAIYRALMRAGRRMRYI